MCECFFFVFFDVFFLYECSVYLCFVLLSYIRSMLCDGGTGKRESTRVSERANDSVHAKNDEPKEFLLSFHTQAQAQ